MDTDEYIGKKALIGITYLTPAGEVDERVQIHGTISGTNDRGWLVIDRADGEGTFAIPPQLEVAEPGEYTLKSSGEVVADPDYLGVWRVTKEPPPVDS